MAENMKMLYDCFFSYSPDINLYNEKLKHFLRWRETEKLWTAIDKDIHGDADGSSQTAVSLLYFFLPLNTHAKNIALGIYHEEQILY